MRLFRLVLLVVGVLAFLMGVLWMAQGSGIFPYPAHSFMIDQTPWIWRGLGLTALGAVGVFVSRRI